MLQRLFEKLRSWAEAMDGVDDPRGDYLLMLEDRVSRLEGEVGRLRRVGQTMTRRLERAVRVSPSDLPAGRQP